MKKIIAMLMVVAMATSFAACNDTGKPADETTAVTTTAAPETEKKDEAPAPLMNAEEFAAAALESAVTVETYIQAKQGWWEKDGVGVATFYTQNEEGAYFIYEMPCSKDDYDNKLVQGAKIRVSGYKAEWSGEIEIIDATYEVLEGSYIAPATDLTAKLGTDELIKFQNYYAGFYGMTVEKIEYKNGTPGEDIYVTLGYNGASYNFCVESYLTGPDTDVYKAVGELNVGDIIGLEGFAYWYEGINTHITKILDER